jgi:hypothetical protein
MVPQSEAPSGAAWAKKNVPLLTELSYVSNEILHT